MKTTILLVLLCAAVREGLGGHFFVREKKTWGEAQAFCREKYFDLSSVGNQNDLDSLKNVAQGTWPVEWDGRWIGLCRENVNSSKWLWSGGEALTYKNWDEDQPDNRLWLETVGEIVREGKWNDRNPQDKQPFYCSTGSRGQVKKTWEEALEHCRQTRSDLVSLDSDTEKTWAQNKMERNHISGPVWIGLRFLGDTWLWMSGNPLVNTTWSSRDQDYQCPVWRRCGALTEGGLWENLDCVEKLHFLCK